MRSRRQLLARGSLGLAAFLVACAGVSPTALPTASLPAKPSPTALPPALPAGSAPSPARVTPPEVPTRGPAPSATAPLSPVAPPPPIGSAAASAVRSAATPRPASPAASPTPNGPYAARLDLQASAPSFSDVSQRTPADVLLFLKGKLADYPGTAPANTLNFSPADILETMDTVVLDTVQQQEGSAALQRVREAIARAILVTLTTIYPNQRVLVALDAGHGGDKTYFWDPGSNGTEALHTRAVVSAMESIAQAPEFQRIILRRIFNDSIADDFGQPTPESRKTVNSILMRQIRASMLAVEAATWNRARPELPVAVHEISVHFNAGAGGALVLHQGDTVRPEFVARSVDYAKQYLHTVLPNLNNLGLLPSPLRLWGGNGLHDDVMMYRPDYLPLSTFPANVTLRYGNLQGNGYLPHFVNLLLEKGI